MDGGEVVRGDETVVLGRDSVDAPCVELGRCDDDGRRVRRLARIRLDVDPVSDEQRPDERRRSLAEHPEPGLRLLHAYAASRK